MLRPYSRTLKGKGSLVIGLFLTLSVQILALVIYSADDKPLFPVGKRITVSSATNGSLQSQWQTTDDCLGFDLACTMHRLSGLTTGEDPVERTGKAADFVRELQNAIKDTGKQLYLVLHAPTAIVPDKSLIGMSFHPQRNSRKLPPDGFEHLMKIPMWLVCYPKIQTVY